jgi:hypothetical protein
MRYDPDDDKKKIEGRFTDFSPRWRYFEPGLNIEGIYKINSQLPVKLYFDMNYLK